MRNSISWKESYLEWSQTYREKDGRVSSLESKLESLEAKMAQLKRSVLLAKEARQLAKERMTAAKDAYHESTDIIDLVDSDDDDEKVLITGNVHVDDGGRGAGGGGGETEENTVEDVAAGRMEQDVAATSAAGGAIIGEGGEGKGEGVDDDNQDIAGYESHHHHHYDRRCEGVHGKAHLILAADMAGQPLMMSMGRTRVELNRIPSIEQYMNDCKFGQAVVSQKGGKIYAITLNDQWNTLATHVDDVHEWFVGVGAGRKRNASLVAKSTIPIPLFQSPKIKERTCKIYYVGHYSIIGMHELEDLPEIMMKQRQLVLRFSFQHFDTKFSSIIAQDAP